MIRNRDSYTIREKKERGRSLSTMGLREAVRKLESLLTLSWPLKHKDTLHRAHPKSLAILLKAG